MIVKLALLSVVFALLLCYNVLFSSMISKPCAARDAHHEVGLAGAEAAGGGGRRDGAHPQLFRSCRCLLLTL